MGKKRKQPHRSRLQPRQRGGQNPKDLIIAALISWAATAAIWVIGWMAYSRHLESRTRLHVDLRVLLLALIIHIAALWTTIALCGRVVRSRLAGRQSRNRANGLSQYRDHRKVERSNCGRRRR